VKSGIGPVKLLYERSTTLSWVRFPKVEGRDPFNILLETLKVSNCFRFIIVLGRGPESWLLARFKSQRLMAFPMEDGILPLNWLFAKFKRIIPDSKRLGGIGPEIELLLISILFMVNLELPIEKVCGIGVEMELLSRRNIAKLGKLEYTAAGMFVSPTFSRISWVIPDDPQVTPYQLQYCVVLERGSVAFQPTKFFREGLELRRATSPEISRGEGTGVGNCAKVEPNTKAKRIRATFMALWG
jgi:hypothetical protein